MPTCWPLCQTNDVRQKTAVGGLALASRRQAALVPGHCAQVWPGRRKESPMDKNLIATEEARAHSEKNWAMMLAALKKFLEK